MTAIRIAQGAALAVVIAPVFLMSLVFMPFVYLSRRT